jgi:hypothetical protein
MISYSLTEAQRHRGVRLTAHGQPWRRAANELERLRRSITISAPLCLCERPIIAQDQRP